MKKQVVAKNCKITALPQGWTAKTNNQGTCVLEVPQNMAGMFGGVMSAKAININGFSATSFDAHQPLSLIGNKKV